MSYYGDFIVISVCLEWVFEFVIYDLDLFDVFVVVDFVDFLDDIVYYFWIWIDCFVGLLCVCMFVVNLGVIEDEVIGVVVIWIIDYFSCDFIII